MNIVFTDADSGTVHNYPLFINDKTYNCLFNLQKVKLAKSTECINIAVSPRIWMTDRDSVFIKLMTDDCIADSLKIICGVDQFTYTTLQEKTFTILSFSRAELTGSPAFEFTYGYDLPQMYCFRDIPNLRKKKEKLNNYDDDIEQFEEYDLMSFPPAGCILFIGSSSVRLWRDVQHDFPDLTCINRGFGGSTTSDAVYYFDRIVKPYDPSKIVLFTGSNDLNKGMKPDAVVEDYKKFLDLVKAELPNSEILVLSVKISVSTKKLQKELEKTNALLKKLVVNYPRSKFVDVIPMMTDKTGAPLPAVFCGDSTHLNAEGYRKLADVVRPYLYDKK